MAALPKPAALDQEDVRKKIRDILLDAMIENYLTGTRTTFSNLPENPKWLEAAVEKGVESHSVDQAITVLKEAGIDVDALVLNARR